MLDLLIPNEEKIEAKANQVASKVKQYLLDINADGDPADNATSRKIKLPWSIKTDEGFYRDIEITVRVVEKPHKLMGSTKFSSRNDNESDGQMRFGIEDEEDDDDAR